jgi:ABC-type glycerol-3-phosphate transport system substrate-binding protein
MAEIDTPHTLYTQVRTRRQLLRMVALGVGAAALSACGGLPGLAPTATPIIFGVPTTPEPAATPAPGAPENTPVTPDVVPTAPAVVGNAKIELRLDYWDSSVRPAVELFEGQNPDIKVILPINELNEIQRGNHGTLMLEDSAPDICAIGRDWLGEYIATDGLLDLGAPPYEAARLKSDFVAPLWQNGEVEGRQYALPWLSVPSAIAYRADVLKAAGFESEPEALQQQLQRWDDFLDLGVALKAKRSDTMLVSDAADLFWTALSQSTRGMVESGQALIEEHATRPGELAMRARSEGVDGNLQQNEVAFAEIRQGKIVSLFVGPWFDQFITREAADTVGSWRLMALPEGSGSFGAVFLAIPALSRHKEEAWALLQFLTATDQAQNAALKTGAGFPVYTSAWDDPFYDQPSATYGEQRALQLWTQLAQQSAAAPISAYDRVAREVIEVELFQILFSQKDPAKAMQDAEKALMRKVEGLRA